jgi:hypothetical protein
MPKSYRIRTQVGIEKQLDVKIEQDFDFLELLSLKLTQSDVYERRCADYGVVAGRVLVNGGFGLQNAKLSIFIPISSEDENNPIISELYPYKSAADVNEDGYRYNLLPKTPSYSGHVSTGSFPSLSEVLLNRSYVEVFDKYYKYTVTTNESGDFMIFGVPLGSQTLILNVDLSDIGCFSLSPQDLIDSGYSSESQFDGSKFKSSSNLDELPQIISLVKQIDIQPFWGDEENCIIGILRQDFDLSKEINLTIKPTAVFMGSIISTTDDDAIKTSCKPKNNTGNLCELISGPGQILAIRQTTQIDSSGRPILEVAELPSGGKVIDGDGSYLVSVPMNLEYITTDEFGNQVISNDPTIGIPTKGKYRFKFKWETDGGLEKEFQRGNFLVPNIKEYGWSNSNVDPFDPASKTTTTLSYAASANCPPFAQSGGIEITNVVNASGLTITINGNPYTGSIQSIPITAGDLVTFTSTAIDNSTPQQVTYNFYPQYYFDVLRSYAFSLDWDDYVDQQAAINCDDTFYEFHYNKVYTTAMFLDRYKNGIGRARHLGIKEIDNRSCKSTVNTFPVNDIIRNFDAIFFIFNILINILSFPFLLILFVAHFIAWAWPVLKYLLVVLGIYFAYDAVRDMIDWINSGIENGAFSPLGGPVVNIGLYFRIAIQALSFVFRFALAAAFTLFTIGFLIRLNNFPRLGLPMIAYPECTSCDCECGNAEIDDDIDQNSVNDSIQQQEGDAPESEVVLASAKSFLAPVNLSGSYNVTHPNYENLPGEDVDDNNGGPFNCGSGSKFKSLLTTAVDQDVDADVVARALIDFKRMFSGYDVLSSSGGIKIFNNEFYLYHAPQPWLFAAADSTGSDERWWSVPNSETYPQKLNDFNTRDKFFSGVNKIKTTVNPSLGNPSYDDQVLVVLANPGTSTQIGVGNIISFQDPALSSSNFLLTGATTNQLGNNAITGTTLTGSSITVPITFATGQNTDTTINVFIDSPQQTGLSSGIAGREVGFLQYNTDIEYFQLVQGWTVADFLNLANTSASGFYPKDYLLHEIKYRRPDCSTDSSSPYNYVDENLGPALSGLSNNTNYEVLIFVRGVDAQTQKQEIKYDLSTIFGQSPNTVVVTGDYYMNVPVQKVSSGIKPQAHNVSNGNQTLYHTSYTFSADPTNFTAFTSNLPYYYLSTDDSTVVPNQSYKPVPNSAWKTTPQLTVSSNMVILDNVGSSLNFLPKGVSDYIGGGSFLAGPTPAFPNAERHFSFVSNSGCNPECQRQTYYSSSMSSLFYLYAVYSSAYYRYNLGPAPFNNSQRMVMRSDRIPTSTKVENGAASTTGFGLHQNNNFIYYDAQGIQATPTITLNTDIPNGEQYDTDAPTGLTSTLTCEGMVSLQCYTGSGINVGVDPLCVVPTNRVKNGCYCLLNKKYISEYNEDVKLFLEWKTRFTLTLAACRGVFAQTFQNNWINGVLYMFSFNKTNTYAPNSITDPTYNYCEDTLVFNELSNNFYYRSSPWDGSNFIGKKIAINPNWPQSLVNDLPGVGYNRKQILFPTTITDLGSRESFISEICQSSTFEGYFVNQVKATSYQDNSDIVQLGFLSRITNPFFRQRILPISTGGSNSEGKGIVQFFNSTRKGDRIDGDWAQMLSINSEWKITPFLNENYPNSASIYFGTSNTPQAALFGLFYETQNPAYINRRQLSPGVNIYSLQPLVQSNYGYPKSQEVPHYKWTITSDNTIFGSEDNNWDTDVLSSGGFFAKKYQSLDFNVDPYFKTSTVALGYITNFSPYPTTPNPSTAGTIIQPGSNSAPIGSNSVLVGAPYHFYFGLNNGKTAIDKFIKIFINVG